MKFKNPFRPGAGHMPPYLAGREHETLEFSRLLKQETILENLVLTGLRGLGKTVLLERFKPTAIASGWLWAGTDLSESTSISEQHLALRLLTDLSVATSSIIISTKRRSTAGLINKPQQIDTTLDFTTLKDIYDSTPGLIADKLKAVLEFVWMHVETSNKHGIVFAYDEAQNLADHHARNEYPLSLLLDVFQSIQRKGILFMLALTGLPTLFPKLVAARTFSERMFRVIFLEPLSQTETVEAIQKPIAACPVQFTPDSAHEIWKVTHGYPYFIQYFCREIYDVWTQSVAAGQEPKDVPFRDITRKLDSDFFAGRWAKATDRQRELLGVIAEVPTCNTEFTVQEIAEHKANKALRKPFSNSHVSQMLLSLTEVGLAYKNRYGKYAFAVPLLGDFIRRQKAFLEPTKRPLKRITA